MLTFGAFDKISKEYLKYNIKILGRFFSKNEIKTNFQSKIKKKWKE